MFLTSITIHLPIGRENYILHSEKVPFWGKKRQPPHCYKDGTYRFQERQTFTVLAQLKISFCCEKYPVQTLHGLCRQTCEYPERLLLVSFHFISSARKFLCSTSASLFCASFSFILASGKLFCSKMSYFFSSMSLLFKLTSV